MAGHQPSPPLHQPQQQRLSHRQLRLLLRRWLLVLGLVLVLLLALPAQRHGRQLHWLYHGKRQQVRQLQQWRLHRRPHLPRAALRMPPSPFRTLVDAGTGELLAVPLQLLPASRNPPTHPCTTRACRCEDGTTVVPWSTPSRADALRRLQEQEFDVLVVGGGCVGAGAALEAATRGLRVAMVEQSDFAAGTSGRSTKLIHGGIRYLEAAVWNLDYEMYELVSEALEEVCIG